MKAGRSILELAQEIDRQSRAKKDYLVGTEELRLEEAGDDYRLQAGNLSTPFAVNDLAHTQIAQHLGIPVKYYNKMRTEYPEMLVHNVNGWFTKQPATRMIRTLDGTARAFLSSKYRRIDNLEIAETVFPVISQMQDARIESCEITDARMYIKVVNPRLEQEVVPGDVVQSGIVISNSEVGLGSVSVQPLIYRLVCSNGMVVNDAATRKYHVGSRTEIGENYEIYRDETIEADDKAFLMKVRDTVMAAVDETVFTRVVDKMRAAKGVPIVGKSLTGVVELTGKEYGFSKAESEGVLTSLIRNDDMTLYGLSNAVTEYSKQVESYDRATELESIGFNILTMASALWNKINA